MEWTPGKHRLRTLTRGESKKENVMSVNQTAVPSGLSEVEIRSIEKFYEAFNERNPDLLNEACSPDWEDMNPAPGQEPGTNGFKKMMPLFFTAFPDLRIEVDEIVGASGRAGVRARMVGTHQGEIFGVAGSQRPIEVRLYEFHHLQEGRVSHTWHLEDWFEMFQRLGTWPPAQG
jgi:predicted ester cyclase